MTEDPMFSAFATCHVCAALVVDTEQHRAFHEGITKSFEERDQAVQKAFKQHTDAVHRVLTKAGFVKPKQRPRPRPMDCRGGRCRECNGVLVESDELPNVPTRESDVTVPYLICLTCLREIRRG
ncbi:hypothetical protein ACLBYD_30600 [Rhodococcus sp. C26F]